MSKNRVKCAVGIQDLPPPSVMVSAMTSFEESSSLYFQATPHGSTRPSRLSNKSSTPPSQHIVSSCILMMLPLCRYFPRSILLRDRTHNEMQTTRDLSVLRYQIGNEAIKVVIEYLPSQYNKRTLQSKPTRAAYVQAIISDKQYPFIWEYFQPGSIPVGGAKC